MSRVQLALNVDNLDEAVEFYSKLFNTEPAKLKDGYANFVVADPPLKLVLLENPGKGGSLNHLGVEVKSSDTVHAEIGRLVSQGMFTEEEIGTTCCFATQDKVWVTGPGGEKWEIYTVLADSETFGSSPRLTAVRNHAGPQRNLPRRLLAEFTGTALLVTVVVGSGIAAPELSPDDVGLQLLQNSIATALGLARSDSAIRPGVRRALQSRCISADWLLGRRRWTGISGSHRSSYAVPNLWRHPRRSVGERHVRPPGNRDRNQEPRHNRAPRRRDRRYRRADRPHLRPGTQRPSGAVGRCGRRVHRGRVLVHQ